MSSELTRWNSGALGSSAVFTTSTAVPGSSRGSSSVGATVKSQGPGGEEPGPSTLLKARAYVQAVIS